MMNTIIGAVVVFSITYWIVRGFFLGAALIGSILADMWNYLWKKEIYITNSDANDFLRCSNQLEKMKWWTKMKRKYKIHGMKYCIAHIMGDHSTITAYPKNCI